MQLISPKTSLFSFSPSEEPELKITIIIIAKAHRKTDIRIMYIIFFFNEIPFFSALLLDSLSFKILF